MSNLFNIGEIVKFSNFNEKDLVGKIKSFEFETYEHHIFDPTSRAADGSSWHPTKRKRWKYEVEVEGVGTNTHYQRDLIKIPASVQFIVGN